jgi:hypothetical protein
MAEEFAFEDLRRERGAMHGDDVRLGPTAEIVNGAGDEFLAGAAFAFDQDGGTGGCDLLDRLDDGLHHFGLAEDAFDGEFSLHLLLQRHVFVLQVRLRRALLMRSSTSSRLSGLVTKW